MKRYKPEIKASCDLSWGEWIDSYDAVMKESQYGDWTSYQNAHDTIKMYQKRTQRLEARLRMLEEKLFLLEANVAI